MCISYPGRVVALEGPNAVVDSAGRRRRATTLLVPDTQVGDWVMVGAGSILRRLDAAEAAFIVRTLDVAQSASAATSLGQGDQP